MNVFFVKIPHKVPYWAYDTIYICFVDICNIISQQTFACSKLTIETLEIGAKYIQNLLLTLNLFHTFFLVFLLTLTPKTKYFEVIVFKKY